MLNPDDTISVFFNNVLSMMHDNDSPALAIELTMNNGKTASFQIVLIAVDGEELETHYLQ